MSESLNSWFEKMEKKFGRDVALTVLDLRCCKAYRKHVYTYCFCKLSWAKDKCKAHIPRAHDWEGEQLKLILIWYGMTLLREGKLRHKEGPHG